MVSDKMDCDVSSAIDCGRKDFCLLYRGSFMYVGLCTRRVQLVLRDIQGDIFSYMNLMEDALEYH